MNYISPLTNKINVIMGAIVALLSYIFGDHWILFMIFLLLNAGDFVSRWIAARLTGEENSKRCFLGLVKKLGYWLMIIVAFVMSIAFIEIGNIIGVDLGVTTFLGWFVLASLMINEIRSIFENLVDAGYNVPKVIIKGLSVANKAIDGVLDIKEDHEEGDYNLNLTTSLDDINGKKRITLEVSPKGEKVEG